MTQDQFVAIASSALVGIVMAVAVLVLGGPSWASFGFGMLAYYIARSRDPR